MIVDGSDLDFRQSKESCWKSSRERWAHEEQILCPYVGFCGLSSCCCIVGRSETGENLPDEPLVLICANHSSGWDPVLLVCALAMPFPLRIMAKEQLFKITHYPAASAAWATFPVNRGSSDIGAVKTSIKT